MHRVRIAAMLMTLRLGICIISASGDLSINFIGKSRRQDNRSNGLAAYTYN